MSEMSVRPCILAKVLLLSAILRDTHTPAHGRAEMSVKKELSMLLRRVSRGSQPRMRFLSPVGDLFCQHLENFPMLCLGFPHQHS